MIDANEVKHFKSEYWY